MSNLFFILGARDPEMMEISKVLEAQGLEYAWATVNGYPVRAPEAYGATGISGLLPKGKDLVFVECEVMGLHCTHQCDHHRPGDPGYGKGPEAYFEGSSLGQVLTLLGLEPTDEQRIICAADHCLARAYAGECPGIEPEKLAAWRVASRSQMRNISAEELISRIDEAQEVLKKAPLVELDGVAIAWFEDEALQPQELSEASARLGKPYMYRRREFDGRMKAGILSAPARVIQTWMTECGLDNVYGDPERGFAGGYF